MSDCFFCFFDILHLHCILHFVHYAFTDLGFSIFYFLYILIIRRYYSIIYIFQMRKYFDFVCRLFIL